MKSYKEKYREFTTTLEKLSIEDLETAIKEGQEQGYPTSEERMIFIALVTEKGRRVANDMRPFYKLTNKQ